MPAYWVARSQVIDPVEYKKYTDLVPGILAKFGGKVLARGGSFKIMEGTDKFQPLRRHGIPELSSRASPASNPKEYRRRGSLPPQRGGRGRDHRGRGRATRRSKAVVRSPR